MELQRITRLLASVTAAAEVRILVAGTGGGHALRTLAEADPNGLDQRVELELDTLS